MKKTPIPDVVRVDASPFPAWEIDVRGEGGRVVRRFKSTAECDAWLVRHMYRPVAWGGPDGGTP